MRKWILCFFVLGVASAVSADLWTDLAGYKLGDESVAPKKLEEHVKKTAPADYGAVEAKLIEIVEGDGTRDGKMYACRMLQRVGTKKSVPALATLLHDEVLSHYARLALERMKAAPAAAALTKALSGAPDKVKAGILGSLAKRREAGAVPAIVKETVNTNPEVANAAIRALGLIGGEKGLAALNRIVPSNAYKTAVLNARINAASTLVQDGNRKNATKVLLAVLRSDAPEMTRVAALTGLVDADEKKAAVLIEETIQGGSASLRQAALVVIATKGGPLLTEQLIGNLGTYPPETQAAVINLLGERGDASAVKGLVPYMAAQDPKVKEAALAALGKLGDRSHVKMLLEQGAVDAVAKLMADGVNDELISLLEQNASAVAAIQVLARRGARKAGPKVIALTSSAKAEVGEAAWKALPELASESDISALMDLLLAAKEPNARNSARNAVKSVCAEAKDRNACFKTIAGYFDKADGDTQGFILELGPAVGTADALALERKALASGNEALKKGALRALGGWPNAGAADDLLKAAKETSGAEQILALRGFIQVAGKSGSDKEKIQRLETASKLTTRPDEKRQVIGALRFIRNPRALAMLGEYLDAEDVRKEAERAAVDLAWDLRQKHGKVVRTVCQKIVETTKDDPIKKKAQKILDELPKGGKG